ncbi:MAG: flotillin family protein [Clostridium chrysemydis]|uniref:flotillin family protein n=1 Tax=Clostridium chrysemydis TaxID=2665504 RepID=UPI003F3937C8
METLIKIGLTGVLGATTVGFILSCYKKCSTDQILVKYGLGGNKVFSGKGTIIIPFFQSYKYMQLTPQNLDIRLNSSSGLVSKDKIKLELEADATFSISKNEDERIVASEKLLSLKPDEIKDLVTEILTGQVRAIVSEMTLTELLEDRAMLKTKVSESAEIELTKFGLDLMNFNIKKIIDLDGIIETLGKKASATAQANAKISIAEQEKESTVKVAEQKKLQEITIAQTEAEKTESVSKSEVLKQQAIEEKESRIAEVNAIESKKRELFIVESQKEVDLKKIDADKEVFIKDQQKEQEIYDAKKITTKKEAEVLLERRRADEIVTAKVESEKRIVEQDATLIMEKNKADNDLKIAETKAQAKITEAKANAEAIKLEAEALAIKEALPILEKAKAEKEWISVYGSADNLIRLKMVEQLPELTKYQAEIFKNFKIDSIHVISGGNGDTAGAVGGEIGGTVSNILKSLPLIKATNDLASSLNFPKLDINGNSTINGDISFDGKKEINVENM